MIYDCGTEVKIGDVIGQEWFNCSDNQYLATVNKIESDKQLVWIDNNYPYSRSIHFVLLNGNDLKIKFLRRKGDIRVGDWIWILNKQNGAPAGSKVIILEVEPNLTVKYQYKDTNYFTSSIDNYSLASLIGIEEVMEVSSNYCTCGGPVKYTGINTLVIAICSACKKEKNI